MNQINVPHKLKLFDSSEELFKELLKTLNERSFKRIAIITSPTPTHLITSNLEIFLFHHLDKLKTYLVVEPSVSYVNQLPLNDFDVVIGVGGGKVIDVAKYAAHINHIPCISIPTSISNDGICSPIAVLKVKPNKFGSLGASIPFAMYVPMHLIQQSDKIYLISGIGDLLSNITAIDDWQLAYREKSEEIDDYAVIVSYNASSEILLLIEKYILLGKSLDLFLKENLKSIIYSLALSGIAMEIAGTSRPASGAEHLISHAIEELYGNKKPHGIQVAFGMYVMSFIKYKYGFITQNEFEELRAVLRFLGIPITLSTIGLTVEELAKAIIHAPHTRSNRYTYLNKINLNQNHLMALLDELFGSGIKAKH